MTAETAAPKTNTTPAERFSKIAAALPRVRDFFVHAVGQVRILKKAYPGIMHAMIFWGVTIQVIGTAINLMQMALFTPFALETFPRSNLYLAYELVMDLAGVSILLGVGMAFFRRLALRPKALESRWDDFYALILLTLIPLAGFTTEGLRLVSATPEWAIWSPVGNMVAGWMAALGVTPESAFAAHPYLVVTHVLLGLTLLASIPYTKLRHLVNTPLNIILRPHRKTGALDKIEDIDEAEILGVGDVTEFKSQQLLSFDACLRCGRCEDACPASFSGMDYSPKTLIQTLRQSMIDTLINQNGNGSKGASAEGALLETFTEEFPWACTTCGACIERCPAFINPVDEVVDLRRYLALTTGKLPKSVADTLRNMERQGNPWGMPADDRLAWAEGLEVRELAPGEETDILLYLGCAFAYDERNKKVARSFVRLLQKANVDFAILGFDEACCGETARRMGHEYIFQVFAEQNIETFKQVKFNRIVTQCPHCFNTLKNEYPQFGGDFKVQHYAEFLAELNLGEMITAPNGNGLQSAVAYHDSCYLGRYNQIYSQPRQLLKQSKTKTIELPRSGEDSFCCGGGGGQMWLETDAETRINHRRLDDAIQANAGVVATACPYCLLMFDDAIRSKGLNEQIHVLDIAEIMERQMP